MLLHINPTRQRGKRTGSLARASGWYMTFFAAGVILLNLRNSLLIVLWLLMVFGTESVPQPADLIVNHGDSAGSAHAHE